jgi:hypothetical protein
VFPFGDYYRAVGTIDWLEDELRAFRGLWEKAAPSALSIFDRPFHVYFRNVNQPLEGRTFIAPDEIPAAVPRTRWDREDSVGKWLVSERKAGGSESESTDSDGSREQSIPGKRTARRHGGSAPMRTTRRARGQGGIRDGRG